MLATIVIIFSVLSLLCLLILHFVSPEFKPSWRMISEYALGKHKWLVTSFFIFWGLASIILALVLWSEVSSTWAKMV
jgi:small-conductance mechanosensitive channel